MEAAKIYRIYFHGPAYQVLDCAWRDGNRIIGKMAKNLPNDHDPSEPDADCAAADRALLPDRRPLEISEHSRMGLPLILIKCVGREPRTWPKGGCMQSSLPIRAKKFDAEVVDADGNRYLRFSGYRTVALPDSVDAEPLNALQMVTS